MPFKDQEKKLAYQRQWYAEHADQVIAQVARRKREDYAGVCVSCGGPTIGQSKGKSPRYCNKKECRKAQWREKLNDGYKVKRGGQASKASRPEQS